MPNLVAIQTVNDGPRNHVISINIQGDGSGDEVNAVIIDPNLADPVCTDFSVWRISGSLTGFEALLTWGGTNKPLLYTIPNEYPIDQDFSRVGGLKNPRQDGYDGTILLTTYGLGPDDDGVLVLELKKKGVLR